MFGISSASEDIGDFGIERILHPSLLSHVSYCTSLISKEIDARLH